MTDKSIDTFNELIDGKNLLEWMRLIAPAGYARISGAQGHCCNKTILDRFIQAVRREQREEFLDDPLKAIVGEHAVQISNLEMDFEDIDKRLKALEVAKIRLIGK